MGQDIAADLNARIQKQQDSVSGLNKWTQEILDWCLSNPELKGRILRFVDVLPSLTTDKAITQHIRDYFPSSETRLPLVLRSGSFITKTPFTSRAVAHATRHMVSEVARQFICGESIEEAKQTFAALKKKGFDFSIDVLGEAVVGDEEADQFQKTYLNLIEEFPKSNISIKLSALTAHFDPLRFEATQDDVMKRLLPLVELAHQKETLINIDMESYAYRDLTLAIVKRLLSQPKLKGTPFVGTVVQAYLRDSEKSLHEFLGWLRENKQPMTLRLVKGAYWDSEVAKAKAAGWPIPVWTEKDQTDAHFEKLTERLLQERDLIRVAVASHNVRSVSHALALHDQSTFSKDTLEFQFLYGMADALKHALVQKGHSVRVYSPYGPLIPGMAYLVRRILENTSNESFLREGVKSPLSHKIPTITKEIGILRERGDLTPSNEPLLDFSVGAVREGFAKTLSETQAAFNRDYPLIINGERIKTDNWIPSRNPANPNQIIGRVARAAWKNVEAAIEAAYEAQTEWDAQSPDTRAQCLVRAAALMRERRQELAAWEIFETGKTWREADADVAEAIDFLEFYAQGMQHYAKINTLNQVPGETNQPLYHGRGMAAIISPWNFPLAILTGMTSAALVTGNTAFIKPAETACVTAAHLVDILLEAGIPPGVLAFLPGPGSEIGKGLIQHPDIHLIAFTGSKEVGLSLVQQAGQTAQGQTHVKKVVAELGGKNAIIVDEDADLDEALTGVLTSAFGYQGQKCSACSRLILLEPIYDRFLDRLIKGAEALVTGDPAHPNTDLGPVIDLPAFEKIQELIKEGKREARLVFEGRVSAGLKSGFFIPPTIFSEAPHECRLTHEEIFGPVLTVFRAQSFEEAIHLANDTVYALTAGVYSRHLSHIEQAKKDLVAGNLYINRKITGAYVGRQPFGGFRLSGTGSKAGGLDYLLHFMHQTIVTENTFRHGFPL